MAIDTCPYAAGGMMGGFGYGWIFQILILVLFFVIIFWLLRNQQGSQKTNEKPKDILKRRLASGEISKKQYDELKKEIE